jgi:hypothetical protein
MTYVETQPIPRPEAERIFASNDTSAIASTLVDIAFHDPDWQWVQNTCLGYARHPVPTVRQVAVTCLGHIARIHRRLDLAAVLPVLEELSRDQAVITEDALDDIRTFVSNAAR